MTITIASPIAERSAVETAATLDPSLPDYEHAADIAMSRRGTRDAFLVHVARTDAWNRVLDVLPQLRGSTRESQDNLTAVVASAYWIAGNSGTAARLVAGRTDHKMMELLHRLIDRGVEPSLWVGAIAAVDPETCYAYKK